MKLRVAGFLDNSMVNGKGLRSVVFVSGCKHNCKGCHNLTMQDYNYGELVEIEEVFHRIQNNIPLIKGVTFSGGEPLDSAESLYPLAKKLKAQGLNIWTYSGYTFDEIVNSKDENKINLLKTSDVLVDGKFQIDLTEKTYKYIGSSNQRIIDVKKSMEHGNVIILKT